MGKMHARLFHHAISRIQSYGNDALELAKHWEFQILTGFGLIVDQ